MFRPTKNVPYSVYANAFTLISFAFCKACQRSYRLCWINQLSALPPNPFERRIAISGEMPVLGYAGYLPFGLECALIIDLIMDRT